MNAAGKVARLPNREKGFTLVELMIAVLIAAILMGLAAPAYMDVRDRAIARGAAGDLVSAVAQAKLEAARRNDFVTVSVRGSGQDWCIGLASGQTGCDCLSAVCSVTQVRKRELNGARLLAPGANWGTATPTDFTIDPRLGMLQGLTGGGSVVVRSPSDGWDYRVQFNLTTTGQTSLCVPSGGKHVLSDYPSC